MVWCPTRTKNLGRFLKVSKSSFLPKNERNVARISALKFIYWPLIFVGFQLQLSSPCNVFNTWCWKPTNVSFEAFLVGNQGWHIKGQMLSQLIWCPKNIFRFIRPVHVHLKQIKWIWKKKPPWKFFFAYFFIPLIKAWKFLSNVTKIFLAISML